MRLRSVAIRHTHLFLASGLLLAGAGCSAPPESDDDSPTPTAGANGWSVEGSCAAGGSLEVISEHIDRSERWDCTLAPYWIKKDVVVENGATLTVGPGVTVRFAKDASLLVGSESTGGLVADGTEAPIRFTSDQAVPAPGDWEAVIIDTQATSAVLVNTIFEYGGDTTYDGSAGSQEASLLVFGVAEIRRSTFSHSAGLGLGFYEGGKAEGFEANTFTDNALDAISIGPDEAGTLEGQHTFSTDSRAQIQGGTVTTSATWSSLGAPWLLTKDVLVEGASAPILTLEAGATLHFEKDVTLMIGSEKAGGLVADGTQGAPILFTSSMAIPKAGDWESIILDTQTVEALLNYVEVSYGGNTTDAGSATSQEGAILVYDAHPVITNCYIHDNEQMGLAFFGTAGAKEFHHNTFANHLETPMLIPAGEVASLQGPNVFDTTDRVHISGGAVEKTGTWVDLGAPYRLLKDVMVGSSSTPVLTLDSGVSLLFDDNTSLIVGLNTPGALVAQNTLFGSSNAVPASGDWEAVILDTQTVSKQTSLQKVIFEYCGETTDDGSSTSDEACLMMFGASPTVKDSTFRHYEGAAILKEDGALPVLSGNSCDDSSC